jgi:monoamine oxidase
MNNSPMDKDEILIIGAGAAGLIAARELSKAGKKVTILEARDRTGGRINTITDKGFSSPIEGGAEFVHGKLPITLQLLKEAGLQSTQIAGEMWQHKNGKLEKQEEMLEGIEFIAQKLGTLEEDTSVGNFLNTNFGGEEYKELRNQITRFVEGYDAADVNKASVMALASEFMEDEEDQYRVNGGYSRLIHYLEQECKANGCSFIFDAAAREIRWKEGEVDVITADGNTYKGSALIITVPIGVLQADTSNGSSLVFTPSIPDKIAAAKEIGYGPVIKVSLEFKEPFWSRSIGFLFSEATIPTWWSQAPESSTLLTGWLAGPSTKGLSGACDEEILKNSIHSLASIFNLSEQDLRQQLKAWHIANWANDAYSLGAYSYATVGGQQARTALAKPVANTIYFSGEGTYVGPDTGTVEAALSSGLSVSKHILHAHTQMLAEH